MTDKLPSSWQWVDDTQAYLHDSGDFLVWQSFLHGEHNGWYGYLRRKLAHQDEFKRRVGPFPTAARAALAIFAHASTMQARDDSFKQSQNSARAYRSLRLVHTQETENV